MKPCFMNRIPKNLSVGHSNPPIVHILPKGVQTKEKARPRRGKNRNAPASNCAHGCHNKRAIRGNLFALIK